MRAVLAALAIAGSAIAAAAASSAAPAAAPASSALAAPPAAVRANPATAVALALRVCLSKPSPAEELTADAVKAGFGPFVQRELRDPTGGSLTYHKLGAGVFDGASIVAVIRRRTITEAGVRPVEWTECGIAFEPGSQNAIVAAEVARTLGPGRPRGGNIGWAYRLSGGRRTVMVLPPATGWLPEVEVAQTLDPSERIATLIVTGQGPVTWVQVGYFRLMQRGER